MKKQRVKKSKRKKTTWRGWVGGTILLWLAGVFIVASYWANGQFGEISFATIIFHLKEPLEGTNMDPFVGGIIQTLIVSVLLTVVGILFARSCNTDRQLVFRIHKKRLVFSLDFWNRRYVLHAAMMFAGAAVVGLVYLGVPQYVSAQVKSSTLYEDYYVDPAEVAVTFPEEKQNLIYIFMESMENTFMSVEDGGLEYTEMIPQMRDLQLANTNFTSDATVNGAMSPYGTTWTMGGIVAQTAGIPLNIPAGGNALEDGYQILGGAYSIGEVLEKEGYIQEFLVGSDAEFGGRKNYLTTHGGYEMRDYVYAKAEGWIPEDYYVWWGYEDQKLYDFAKSELTSLAETGEPFNLTMLTVDTHFIGGYYCELCQDDFGWDTYADTYACASRQVTAFVEWVQEQPFADNTTIIICGDHPTMDNNYVSSTLGYMPEEGQRQVYTTVINPVCRYTLDYNRSFTTFDMYPTTLASLGCQIEGERMGLGTNLYSDTQTLVEMLGIEGLNAELEKHSKFYDDYILYQ